MKPEILFDDAVRIIGLDVDGLKLEGFRTDGTSNYLANLNYNGQTWAAALRMPARGASIDEFLDEKARALESVSYLLHSLAGGVDVGFDCVLQFGGTSALVENSSTQTFLRSQHLTRPLLLVDHTGGREKRIAGLEYPECISEDQRGYISSYQGPFYLSRGAPAWETLEEYPELEEATAHSLAVLHRRTGKGQPVSKEHAVNTLSTIRADMHSMAEKWSPEQGSKEFLALEKSLRKWHGENDNNRHALIRQERFLRTALGRTTYRKLFDRYTSALNEPKALRAFCHGDCHGGNFIIVRYQYALSSSDVMIDRVFLNDVFERDPKLERVGLFYDSARSTFEIDSLRLGSRESIATASRKMHHEIHPIDLDSGTGTVEATKVLHLYDALLFAISLENITSLFATTIPAEDVLLHYYDGMMS